MAKLTWSGWLVTAVVGGSVFILMVMGKKGPNFLKWALGAMVVLVPLLAHIATYLGWMPPWFYRGG